MRLKQWRARRHYAADDRLGMTAAIGWNHRDSARWEVTAAWGDKWQYDPSA